MPAASAAGGLAQTLFKLFLFFCFFSFSRLRECATTRTQKHSGKQQKQTKNKNNKTFKLCLLPRPPGVWPRHGLNFVFVFCFLFFVFFVFFVFCHVFLHGVFYFCCRGSRGGGLPYIYIYIYIIDVVDITTAINYLY